MKLLNARRATVVGLGVAVASLAVMGTVSPTSARLRGPTLSADLTGAAEVPGPGDPDGTGRGEFRIHAKSGEVCYELSVKRSPRRPRPRTTAYRPGPRVRRSTSSSRPAPRSSSRQAK